MASDSESFYEDSPAATPQPLDADMPSLHQLARATPPASMMAGPASSSITLAAEIPRASKGRSSTMSSSITPPPSTQVASMRGKARDDTPSAMLSSPPPTISNGITRAGVTASGAYRPSNSKINSASPEQLREIIYGLLANEAKQEAMLAESRMTIAHLNLQMNMLSAEKESEIQRMEVEHSMTKREVAMLSMARSNTNTPGSSLLTNYIKLDEKHQALVEICDGLHRRLDRAKKVIENKSDEIFDLQKEIGMYKNRIREKHDTYQHLRSPGGPFHSSNLKTPIFSNPDTPQQYRETPKRTPVAGRSVGREGPFDALLLADRVLSQENNSAPSTPIISRRPEPRTPVRHQRAAQSLSSLQTTPGSARPMTGNVSLLPSAQFHNPPPTRERRRKSRDSTISAPDAEEIARAALAGFGDSSEDDVNESQASQEAAALLRADPKESFEVLSSRTGTPIPAEKGIQVKLHTTVTKTAMMEKRKYVDDGGDNMAKKPRVDVGLGIFSPRG